MNKEDFQKELDNFIFAKKNFGTNLILGYPDCDFFSEIEASQIDNIIKEQLAINNKKKNLSSIWFFLCFVWPNI